MRVPVKGQSILGREDFVKKLTKNIKGQEEIEEIPRHQRFVGRPCLETLFNKKTGTKRRERTVKKESAFIINSKIKDLTT